MKRTTQSALIAQLNSAYPQLRAVPYSEMTERNVEGIWFKGSEDEIDGVPVFDSYNDDCEVHPSLEAILKNAGWEAQPYDSGTLTAFPA